MMTRTNVDEARCEALFASTLQCSVDPAPGAVSEAIRSAVRRLGNAGCAALMAQEFGDHPEQAAERMRWARRLLSQAAGTAPATPETPSARPAGRRRARSRKQTAAGNDRHAA